MNIKELFTELGNQITRLTGTVLDPNLSEAEQLAIVQSIPSYAEQNTQFTTNIEALQAEVTELKSKLDVIEQTPKFTMEDVNAKIEAAVKLNSEQLNKGFATEISKLKELAESNKKPAGEQLDATIESTATKPEVVQKEMQIGGKKLKF